VKLLVGLGNPGPEYADTRHNVGVRVIEHFARVHRIDFGGSRFSSRFGIGRMDPAVPPTPPEAEPPPSDASLEVALLAPQTFMNRSGAAVAEAVAGLALGGSPEPLLVVLDDVDLPFGRLRLRPSGGAGGHRGLAHILECLDRSDVPRLRFGVGRPAGSTETADHVLAPFSAEETALLPAAIERASAAASVALRSGVVAAMNAFNREAEASGTENG
jgi:PTH1 family peptidyl-tRNA hydrolase